MCQACGAASATRYCSNACRQRAYRNRKPPAPAAAPPVDSFLGREEECVQLGRLLRRTRLVTLVGPPGSGKSRLAGEFAGRKPGARVVVHDDCNHPVDDCARLVSERLDTDRELRVVATSREPLRVAGEALLPVGPLAPPHAAQLFAERAHLARTEIIDEICARLDHLPLAIEFAARLVPALPPAELLARLDRRLDLLITGSRTGPVWHTSLRAALDRSWHALTTAEQRVLRRLSVFAGGFDLDAATEVSDVPECELVCAVASLVAKSMVVPPDAHGRYRLLESIRLYAAERLAEAGDEQATRSRALRQLTRTARAFVEPVFTRPAALTQAALDRANLEQCARWASDGEALLLATTLALSWWRTGDTARGRVILREALARTNTDDRGLALTHAGWLAAEENDHAEALALTTAAVQVAEENGEHLGRALNALAAIHTARGEHQEACALYERCLDLFDLPLDLATVRHHLASALLWSGDIVRAEQLVGEALPVYQAGADSGKLAALLHTAGTLALRRDDITAAENLYLEALGRAPAEVRTFPCLLQGLAIIAVRRNEPERALRLLGAVSAAHRHVGALDPRWLDQVAEARTAAEVALPPARARIALECGARLSRDRMLNYACNRIWEDLADDSPLTAREREIAAMVACGDTNRQIAKRMQLSERTIEARLTKIREKLGLHTRTQVAAWLLTRSA